MCPSWNWNKIQQYRVGEPINGVDDSVVRDNIVFDPTNIKVMFQNILVYLTPEKNLES